MASKLMHDGGGGKTPWWQQAKNQLSTPKAKKFIASKTPKASNSLGNGNLKKLVKKYNPPKKNYGQPAQNTAKKNNPAPKKYVAPKKAAAKKSSSGGGAYGAGGKFYKNGYVDSKGNRVINGKWAAPKKSSGGGSSTKSSAPKKTVVAKAPVAKKTSAAVAPKAKPKIAMLASTYLDQIYRNQIGELDAGDSAFKEDTAAKVARLGRDFNTNRANVTLNKTNSLQNSADDYASRGMMRSGAYQTNMAESNKVFGDQQARMLQNKNDDEAEYSRAKADYLRGSGTQRQDAKRQQADRIAVENAKRAAQNSS